jgi:uncharacterized protein YdiU (UPF0061 family)
LQNPEILAPPRVVRPGRPPAVPLETLALEATFTSELPGDPREAVDNQPRQVPGASYSRVLPTPVAQPRLLAWSDALGAELRILRPEHPAGPAVEVLAGNRVLPGTQPYSARYGGHQFGNWAGQLGDGRAITLGERVLEQPDGTLRRWELQLKGAGRTPYSRFADGRAVLRSSLREYLCSEAMHALGVPTTRALSLVATGDPVVRDMFYDGNPQAEPGAIVCRVAPTFVRFGNFEVHAWAREHDLLRRLADWVIRHHYPELGAPGPAVYADWFTEICRRTAVTIAHWMRVGFVHGVMNTDNMSILGLTIDYGPYGWLEGFDPTWTPNTTDAQGRRYSYGNQPQIGMWNLARLAGSLEPLVGDRERLEAALEVYADSYQRTYRGMLAAKLGLRTLDREGDDELIAGLFQVLQRVETDLTLFHRNLAAVEPGSVTAGGEIPAPLRAAYYDDGAPTGAHREALGTWLVRWAARVRAEGRPDAERVREMNAVNPKYVPRNYLAQLAIDAATAGDVSVLERLLSVLERPYDEQPDAEEYAARRPEWVRHRAGCSALSCSS